MRVSFFLYLRSTAAWRWIRAHPKLVEFPRWLGRWLVPESALHAMRVRSGPAAGLLFELHPRSQQWYWDGSFERAIQERVAAMTGPGATFYDIGANFGFYSLLAARRGAEVFAFEPNPVNVVCLARNARLNALEKSVETVPLAAYSATGHVSLIFPGPEHTHQHDMRARVAPVASEVTNEATLRVPSVTLDEFARSHPAPSLVKLDVEGAELEVLKGAERLFDQTRPRLICETDRHDNERLVTDWLIARGYSVRRLEVSGRDDQAFLFAEPLGSTDMVAGELTSRAPERTNREHNPAMELPAKPLGPGPPPATRMNPSAAVLARLRLECSGIASRLARVPLVGPGLRSVGYLLLPRGTLVWTTIRAGDARGLWVLVDARTGKDLRRGTEEPGVQDALDRCLAPGQVFYDLGANFGFFTLLASRRVGPSGKVVAFEPEPDVADRLRRTLERNGISNVAVVEAAVWSGNGTVAFERGLGSPDRKVGRIAGSASGRDSMLVRAVTLDEFTRSAPPPDLIKCDVEGAEVEVFEGAGELLRKFRPTVICEVHSPENWRRLMLLFEQAGYRAAVLEQKAGYPVHILARAAS